jgi:hypothetical protein
MHVPSSDHIFMYASFLQLVPVRTVYTGILLYPGVALHKEASLDYYKDLFSDRHQLEI